MLLLAGALLTIVGIALLLSWRRRLSEWTADPPEEFFAVTDDPEEERVAKDRYIQEVTRRIRWMRIPKGLLFAGTLLLLTAACLSDGG